MAFRLSCHTLKSTTHHCQLIGDHDKGWPQLPAQWQPFDHHVTPKINHPQLPAHQGTWWRMTPTASSLKPLATASSTTPLPACPFPHQGMWAVWQAKEHHHREWWRMWRWSRKGQPMNEAVYTASFICSLVTVSSPHHLILCHVTNHLRQCFTPNTASRWHVTTSWQADISHVSN